MSTTHYFNLLCEQVAGGLAYFWPVTILLAAWIWAFAATPRLPTCGRCRLFVLGCLPPFVFPVVFLTVGTVFVSRPPWVTGHEAPAFPSHVISALLLVQLPLAAGAIWWWRGQRFAVAASWMCGGYVSFGAGIISSMSVTGIWM